ncbi:hypothetical protein N1851_026634 [Merluccius polli]|uniref:Uncharacterized protein n=1 Tax=Merluccius polli TaxID=89951 RepID=A0AA47MBM1_MERPO|nr:hypothetical protein N1851_026634 [Merluccius polli]
MREKEDHRHQEGKESQKDFLTSGSPAGQPGGHVLRGSPSLSEVQEVQSLEGDVGGDGLASPESPQHFKVQTAGRDPPPPDSRRDPPRPEREVGLQSCPWVVPVSPSSSEQRYKRSPSARRAPQLSARP